jgi:hypothetical protein
MHVRGMPDRVIFYSSSGVDGSFVPIEVRGRGADDPEGANAAAILTAYLDVEHARVFRRLLWRRLGMMALVAWALKAFTPLLPAIGLALVVVLVGTGGLGAFLWERRARNSFQKLLDRLAQRG